MSEIHVQVTQTIERPADLVRRHFLDMEHHARHPVHAAARFAVGEQSPTHCVYTQETRLGPFKLREDARLERDGDDVVNRSLNGASAGMVVRFSFRPIDPSTTEVTADIRLPRTGLRKVIAPLLRRMLRSGFARALEEDRIDLEERGYPRA
jgi:uncharacterized membrane protein